MTAARSRRGGGSGPAKRPTSVASSDADVRRHRLKHSAPDGLFTALAIGIHNFPEGLATFLAALEDPRLGVAIAIAIALHNIPEGISVSVPIFYATGRPQEGVHLLVAQRPGRAGRAVHRLPGPAVLARRRRPGRIPPQVMGILFGGVAGIMVYISLDELLPTSRAYGKGHDSLFGLIAGMAGDGAESPNHAVDCRRPLHP